MQMRPLLSLILSLCSLISFSIFDMGGVGEGGAHAPGHPSSSPLPRWDERMEARWLARIFSDPVRCLLCDVISKIAPSSSSFSSKCHSTFSAYRPCNSRPTHLLNKSYIEVQNVLKHISCTPFRRMLCAVRDKGSIFHRTGTKQTPWGIPNWPFQNSILIRRIPKVHKGTPKDHFAPSDRTLVSTQIYRYKAHF